MNLNSTAPNRNNTLGGADQVNTTKRDSTLRETEDRINDFNRKSDHDVGRFNNFMQFWLTCLGFAVGYGNIWRFPYLLYNNGGGVFLIPFSVWIIFISFPIYYLETSYGQLYRRTLHTYFDSIDSRFVGVSFSVVWLVFFMAVYYNGLIAWSCNFFLLSFQKQLPWAINDHMDSGSDNSWNENYFKRDFLNMSENILDINHYMPWIIASFVIVTVITFITEFRSLGTAQFAVWIFIPSAYIILFILFIKGLMLEGRSIGWTYLFKPEWDKIFTFQIWIDAASQSIFSAGLGIHAVILFASHKTRGESILSPSVGVPILNFLTSIFASITLFSFIGHESFKTGVPIQDMPIDGLELAFVAYPALLSTFPFPQFWSALFFLMLVFIGLSTQFAFVDVACTFIQGLFFRFNYLHVSKTLLTLVFWIVILIIDILLIASDAGYHWIKFFDHYVVGLNLVIWITLQIIIFAHYLPIEDIEARVESKGEKFPWIYKIMLKYITPVLWGILAIISIINEVNNPLDLPPICRILAFALFVLPNLLWIGFYVLDPWNPNKWDWQQDNIKILENELKS